MSFRNSSKRHSHSRTNARTAGVAGKRRPKTRNPSAGSGAAHGGSPDYQAVEPRVLLAQLLPDLISWASTSGGYMYDYVIEGNLLRFSTALANKGVGNMEIRGGAINTQTNTQEVWQRIYNDNGTWSDRLAGSFIYHAGHGHIHFDGYAIYNLRAKLPNGDPGAIVATGGKVSFCLIDIAKYYPTAGSSTYNSCGQVQGVTAGWADVYNRSLPDQWINITGVAPGDYFLEVITDPFNQLTESDETNNVTQIPVVIPGSSGGTTGDRYEANETFVTATNLGMTSKFDFGGLSIHKTTDVDYFQLVAPETDHFEVEIQFTNQMGNLDLFLYNSQQGLIASSTTTGDGEEIEWNAVAGQTYFIKVAGVNSAVNGYEMYIHGHGNLITEVEYSAQVPVAIPDSPAPAVTSTLQGPNMVISDLNLLLDNLEHTWLGDLRIELISPQGTVQTVLFNSGNGGFLGNEDNFFQTTIDDQAPTHLNDGVAPFQGSYKVSRTGAANPLSVFNGQNALGTWTLRIRDYASSDIGTLKKWGIAFTGTDQNPGDVHEPNNYFPQAVNLGTIGQVTRSGLSIHRTNDVDFFRFVAGLTTPATIDLTFIHSQGNLDMKVYNANLQIIATANSSDNDEHLDLALTAGELYYVEIYSSEGTTSYGLNINVALEIGGTYDLPVLNQQWKPVVFPKAMVNPVVIVSPLTLADGQPATVRIRNLTPTGFEVRVEEWSYQDGIHGDETARYAVFEAGRHVLPDGTVIEAGRSTVGTTPTNLSFSSPFASAPVVLSQVVSTNDTAPVISRIRATKSGLFSVQLQEEEAADGVHAAEQVSWLAVRAGVGMNGIRAMEAGFLEFNRQVIFTQDFVVLPAFFASSQRVLETDPISHRLQVLNLQVAQVLLEEEQSLDAETTHASEQMGWFGLRPGPIFDSLGAGRFGSLMSASGGDGKTRDSGDGGSLRSLMLLAPPPEDLPAIRPAGELKWVVSEKAPVLPALRGDTPFQPGPEKIPARSRTVRLEDSREFDAAFDGFHLESVPVKRLSHAASSGV